MSNKNAAVLYGYGINCDHETEHALNVSGCSPRRVHVNEIVENPKILENFNLLAFPGGFSYGDDLGSGRVLANKIKFKAREAMADFVNAGKLVIGICNGFQMLTKMGILPYTDFKQRVTLASNQSGKFEDRWVFLRVNQKSPCIFTRGIETLMLPVRHGEGRFFADGETLEALSSKNMIAMQYVNAGGSLAGYPYNPNGAYLNIAGICNEQGTVFGLMPHPEAYNTATNNPYWTLAQEKIADWKGAGLKIFENAAEYLDSRF